MSLQKLVVVGRATRDAEPITAKSGKDFAVFSIAVNYSPGKDKETQTIYYECMLFGEARTTAALDRIKKGDTIAVDGRPEVEAYLDKDGNPQARMKIIVNEWFVAK